MSFMDFVRTQPWRQQERYFALGMLVSQVAFYLLDYKPESWQAWLAPWLMLFSAGLIMRWYERVWPYNLHRGG
jgi:cellulose synthase/poly-beta-1,6-N-acetylglucosamine synthase-like glycosyltransferase